MQDELRALLRETSLITVALAIALGWSLWNLASGAAEFVEGLLTRVPADTSYSGGFGDTLTWVVNRRILTIRGLVAGAIEVAAVLLAGILIRLYRADRLRRAADSSESA